MKVPVEKPTAEPSFDLPAGGQEDPMAGGEAPVGDAPMDDAPMGDAPAAPQSEKPFDDEPFDAGVQADEESDPKHFIQQLSGKLGQSIRTYTDSQGQPDFELEKFAINSIISATHTSEMQPNDQEDIISKIKSSGQGDEEPMAEPEGGEEPMGNEELPSDSQPLDEPEEPTEESFMRENLSKDKKFSIFVETLIKKEMKKQMNLNETIDEILGGVMGNNPETESPEVETEKPETEKPTRTSPDGPPNPWKIPIIKEDPTPKASR